MHKKTQTHAHVILESSNILTVNSSVFSGLTVEIVCFDLSATILVCNGKQNLGLGKEKLEKYGRLIVLVLSPGCACLHKPKWQQLIIQSSQSLGKIGTIMINNPTKLSVLWLVQQDELYGLPKLVLYSATWSSTSWTTCKKLLLLGQKLGKISVHQIWKYHY